MVTWQITPRCFSPNVAVVAATFLLAALHAPLARAQEQPPPWLLCGPAPVSGNYTKNSAYETNINGLAATLPKNTSSSPVLYCTDNLGSVPDIVYGLALCRGDANASACERCVATAFRGAQQGCPLFKDVMVFYDLCQLRFSNRNFLTDDDYFVNTVYLQGSQVASLSAGAFDAAVRRLVNATADYAADNSSRRFGTGEIDLDDKKNPTIYALSQCTPDRTEEICRSCLGTVTGQLTASASFSGRNGGGIFGVWCSFRYEVYPFFSGRSLLQLPAIVATPPGPPKAPDKSKKKMGMVLAIMMPSLFALLAITVICFWFWKRSAPQPLPPYSASPDDIEGVDMLLLDLSTLRTATEDFNESKMLGRGGFGIVYKGILPEGREIAVKRLCHSSRQGIRELKSELVLVAKLHHRNLVRLLGVCLQEEEKILVYEYMPNKSLDSIIFDSERRKELDWVKRFKIISGIARGLQYLHEDSQLKIVHRDLKASNILLDIDYTPKISDFGLAKNFGEDQSKYITRRIAGTYGYMAPEYAMCGQYSVKSDVFSFGVLVLEIVTGRRNSGSYDSDNDVDLLNLVWVHWVRGNIVRLIDPSLNDHPPVDQILKCIHIGLLCVQRKPTARPTMTSVNIMLSSSTVRLPSLSRPALCNQDTSVSASDSSGAYYAATQTGASDNSVAMSCNEESITELLQDNS